MKMITYLKETILAVACVVLILLIINTVLLTSTAINKGIGDILYLDLLLFSIAFLFWGFGYFQFRKKYLKIRQALDEGQSLDAFLPLSSGFYPSLLTDAIRQKDQEYEGQIAQYKENMDELYEYITQWVHEIKIPISVCELILENGDLGEANAVSSLKMELDRTKFLIQQVLYAGRATHYSEDLSVREFCIGSVVKEAVKRNAKFFIIKNIEVALGTLDFTVMSDEKWISYILDQILNNAGKYVKQNGKVEIGAREDEKSVRLCIRDNGIGIPVQDIGRIFDKGFTGENGRKTTKSTGMGMYLSKKMANKLEIGLEVDSRVEEYTKFTLVFYKLSDYFKVT